MRQELFYDDLELADRLETAGPSIFLAGPTSRVRRTPWRLQALDLLRAQGFGGTVVIPEFRDRAFCEAAASRFGGTSCPVPGMNPGTYNILRWETTGIECARGVLFWMPFQLEDCTETLLGLTTRAEVSREIARGPDRIVLGMPLGALSGGHIRYHAHCAGVPIHETLESTVEAAIFRFA